MVGPQRRLVDRQRPFEQWCGLSVFALRLEGRAQGDQGVAKTDIVGAERLCRLQRRPV